MLGDVPVPGTRVFLVRVCPETVGDDGDGFLVGSPVSLFPHGPFPDHGPGSTTSPSSIRSHPSRNSRREVERGQGLRGGFDPLRVGGGGRS